MKTFKRYGIEYTIENTTAVAECDTVEQPALKVTANNGTEITEHIVFGWEMPKTEEDFDDMCEDTEAWEEV